MTVWAIVDPTNNVIINIVDDRGSSASVLQYVPGQIQLDMKTLSNVWAGHQLVNGVWLAPRPDPVSSILSELVSLPPVQLAAAVKMITTNPIVTGVSTVAVVGSLS